MLCYYSLRQCFPNFFFYQRTHILKDQKIYDPMANNVLDISLLFFFYLIDLNVIYSYLFSVLSIISLQINKNSSIYI